MYKKSSRFACVLTLMAASAALASAVAFAPPQNAPLSSSFPGPLWDIVAPNGGTASAVNAHLLLNVPGGSNHDALVPANEALRVVQPIGNVDFDVSIKIDSSVVATDASTSQGLMKPAYRRPAHTRAGTKHRNRRHTEASRKMQRAGIPRNENRGALQYRKE